MREWEGSFTTIHGPVSLEDLVLFGDCYYLPHEEGPEAEALYRGARRMLDEHEHSDGASAFRARAARLRTFCGAMTGLRSRPLFHALSRRTWELREELDLLERFASRGAGEGREDTSITSDLHLPGTYRGGLVARLQHLLVQRPDGAFTRAINQEHAPSPGAATTETIPTR